MIDSDHTSLSIARQCQLLSISRSGFYYQPSGESELNLTLMRLIDEQHMRTPNYGARQMARYLRREGYVVGRKRIRRLMQKMGLASMHEDPPAMPAPEGEPPLWANTLCHGLHAPPGMGMVTYDKARTCLRLVGVKPAIADVFAKYLNPALRNSTKEVEVTLATTQNTRSTAGIYPEDSSRCGIRGDRILRDIGTLDQA